MISSWVVAESLWHIGLGKKPGRLMHGMAGKGRKTPDVHFTATV
jgi:hypothetical protein